MDEDARLGSNPVVPPYTVRSTMGCGVLVCEQGILPLATLLPCEFTGNEETVPSVLKIRGLWQCGDIIMVSDFPLDQPTP